MKTNIFTVNYQNDILYIGSYNKSFNEKKIKNNLKRYNKRLNNLLLSDKYNIITKEQFNNSINIKLIMEFEYTDKIQIYLLIHRKEKLLNPIIRRLKNNYL